METSLTLFELNQRIRGLIEGSMEDEVWVHGELSEGRTGYGNHFYGELVQKDASGNKLIAKARVVCWERIYTMLALRFRHHTGESLRPGMKVQLLVQVTFHELYGYSLSIMDIDPSYTLGDLAMRRKEILQKLQEDGTIDDNKQLLLPSPTQRIAVISSATAAGYGDFCKQLTENEYAFRFHTRLFPAVMQGVHVEESIIAALEAIASEQEVWDAVVIIRGGGAVSDLSDFDSYPLAACVTQMPIPVITGIGHDRDLTVLDMIAHTHLKTPTAVAAFLISRMREEAVRLESLKEAAVQAVSRRMMEEKQRIERIQILMKVFFGHLREQQEHRLETIKQRLRNAYTLLFERLTHHLQIIEEKVRSMDPSRLLQRGYSITRRGDKIIRSSSELEDGDIIITQFANGEIQSTIQLCRTKKNKKD